MNAAIVFFKRVCFVVFLHRLFGNVYQVETLLATEFANLLQGMIGYFVFLNAFEFGVYMRFLFAYFPFIMGWIVERVFILISKCSVCLL